MSPGLVLAVLFVAIGAQLTRLFVPSRGSYPLAVLFAGAGLLCAELLARAGHGGPALGAVHPIADGAGIGVAEVVGMALASPPRWRRR